VNANAKNYPLQQSLTLNNFFLTWNLQLFKNKPTYTFHMFSVSGVQSQILAPTTEKIYINSITAYYNVFKLQSMDTISITDTITSDLQVEANSNLFELFSHSLSIRGCEMPE